MSDIKLKIRGDGIYIKHPKKGESFINALKQTLTEMGISVFNEPDFIKALEENRSEYLKVCSQLPPRYDASVFFEISHDEPEKVIANLIPPKDGKKASKADILLQLDDEGYDDVLPSLKAIDEAIDKQDNQSDCITFVVGNRTLPEINVHISSNEMEASVTIKKPENCNRILVQDIHQSLKKSGVVNGIKEDVIDEIAIRNSDCESVVIAKGVEPVNGKDGEVIYHFDISKKLGGPQIDAHGRADFHNLNIFQSVKEGDELCEITEPSKGIPGKNVLGRDVPSEPGKKVDLPAGNNTKPDPNNPRVLLASISGIAKLIDNKVIVDPILDIKGDVGVGTGNIDFVGAVNVSGSVSDGYEIKAKGDIVINDSCESVIIESDSDVFLKRGVRADENAVIKSGGDVVAKFLEGVKVEAAGSVIVQDYCYHCHIKAGDTVRVQGKKGYITGGRVSAKNCVIAKRLGNPSATRTEILVSALDDQKNVELTEEQQKQFNKLNEMLMEVNKVLDKIEGSEATKTSKSAQATQKEYEDKKGEIIKRMKRINPNYEETDTKSFKHVTVTDIVHPNVLIKIYDASFVSKDELMGIRYYYRKGEILLESYRSSRDESD